MIDLYNGRFDSRYVPDRAKHRFVSKAEIIESGYDLCQRVYLRDYEYPEGLELKELGEVFTITKGRIGAASAIEEGYDFVTSSQQFKKTKKFSYDGEAIVVPLVSSTGHGHASINHIHYVNGKFEAASITAVMMLKPGFEKIINMEFYHAFLTSHKDVLLIPYMRGAANVSLNLDRLSRIKIPLIPRNKQEKFMEEVNSINLNISELEHRKKELLMSRDYVYKKIRKAF